MISKINKDKDQFHWSRFVGFSILFDPGQEHFNKTLLQLDLVRAGEFYKQLHASFHNLKQQNPVLSDDKQFMALPPSSWHVTLWDGINDGNAHLLTKTHKHYFNDFMKSLKWSLVHPEVQDLLKREIRWLNAIGEISFKFRKLYNYQNRVLVVSLMPADMPSLYRLHKIKLVRRNLNAFFEDSFGFATSQRYLPHNSLGYFTEDVHGEKFNRFIEEVNMQLQQDLKNKILTFHRAEVFTFDNMMRFFKV